MSYFYIYSKVLCKGYSVKLKQKLPEGTWEPSVMDSHSPIQLLALDTFRQILVALRIE